MPKVTRAGRADVGQFSKLSSAMAKKISVALAGNPNSGKTTIFNNLTGARQHVGNYPGVTVEKKEGTCRCDGHELHVVDLPGTYSLTAYSLEEVVARNFIIDEKPDVLVDIVDASNLERNLYLATQFIELQVPLILAFNMSDVAKARGYQFDLDKLGHLLGTPIVATVGHRSKGTDELLRTVVSVAEGETELHPVTVHYGNEIEEELEKIQKHVEDHDGTLAEKYNLRWLALKLLENDPDVRAKVTSEDILAAADKSRAHLGTIFGEQVEFVIAERRYGFISGVCQESVKSTVESRHTLSDQIDTVVTNRVVGIPLFLGLMYLVFHLTFTLGDPLMDMIEAFFGKLSTTISALWPVGSDSAIKSLLVDGIIGGVGGVIVFLPNILLLFLAIAFLEDSGYMARAAFIMDELMHKIGLHGKSFIPMVIGFGCSVPAIMATRTLEDRRDRLTTMMVVPLMSCGARLPIYALIIPAFFPEQWYAPMLWLIYLIGIVLAVICARVLKSTLLKGQAVPFVMELPPYRMPTLRGTLIHMWNRGGMYLRKAGTIILAISIILWALTRYPQKATYERPDATAQVRHSEDLAYSYAGRIGRALEPVLQPMGFDWRIGTALIGAFAAKEVFVAQMGIVYAVGEGDESSETLRAKLRAHYSPLVAFCIMLFCLIGMPCMATIVTTWRESGSWRWALLQLTGLTFLAFVTTTIVYQLARWAGIGAG